MAKSATTRQGYGVGGYGKGGYGVGEQSVIIKLSDGTTRDAHKAEIDATFAASEYRVLWSIGFSKIAEGPRLEFEIKMAHVSEHMIVGCKVISNKPWHRKGSYDDEWQLIYKVLPPLE